MASIVSFLLITWTIFLTVPSFILVLEIIMTLFSRRDNISQRPINSSRKKIAVLVPAHNESTGIIPTVEDIKSQLIAGDHLIVVADNCSDDTAKIAAAAGANVIERHDLTKIGKGYALNFGLKHLRDKPPEIVIIIDADCRVTQGSIELLATACSESERPVQALDLMVSPPNSTIQYHVAEFAWCVKNWVRPLGLSVLKLPCQLMGTGMAFPWKVISILNVSSDSVVEDLELGIKLTIAGYPPLFCPSARVTSQFPLSHEGAKNQRERWEHGHIHMILKMVPHLFYRGFIKFNIPLIGLTLDLMIPPLSLLTSLMSLTFLISALTLVFGCSSLPLTISAFTLGTLTIAVFFAWWRFAREILPIRFAFLIFSYVVGKLPLYYRALSGNVVRRWIRTDRTNAS